MKIYLGLITAAALTLAACGGGEQQAAAPAPAPAAEASAPMMDASAPMASDTASMPAMASESAPMAASPAAEMAASAPAMAMNEECAATIHSNDAMQFDAKEIAVKSGCKQFTITLKHTGSQPAAAMGHNIVIAKTADKDAILTDGMSAGAAQDYVKANDERIVAHTKLIGGGEETSVTFEPAKLAKGEAYEFFCSFPGHYAMMNGKINVVE